LGVFTQPLGLTQLSVDGIGIPSLGLAELLEFGEGLPGAIHVLAVMLIRFGFVAAIFAELGIALAGVREYFERGKLTLHMVADFRRKDYAARELRLIRDANAGRLCCAALFCAVGDAPRKQHDLPIGQDNVAAVSAVAVDRAIATFDEITDGRIDESGLLELAKCAQKPREAAGTQGPSELFAFPRRTFYAGKPLKGIWSIDE
jgi:hypothetical protein